MFGPDNAGFLPLENRKRHLGFLFTSNDVKRANSILFM